jgi:hypothetical protein
VPLFLLLISPRVPEGKASALPLLVTGVLLADDADHALAADNLAFLATRFDGSPDFHDRIL